MGWDKVAKPKYLGGLGIRFAGAANEVAFANLNWWVNRESESLWARVLKDKYRDFSGKKHKPSPIWRILRRGYGLYHQGLRVSITGGKNTSFWFDNWLGIGPLHNIIAGPVNVLACSLSVRDVWALGVWNLDVIGMIFPPDIRTLILGQTLQWKWSTWCESLELVQWSFF